MRPSQILLYLFAIILSGQPGPASAQTSTVIIIPTPLPWHLAASACSALGPSRIMYPIPATSTDPVYQVIAGRPEQKFWIRRRGARTCTNLNKGLSSSTWDLLDEDVCSERLPAICKDCRWNGDGCPQAPDPDPEPTPTQIGQVIIIPTPLPWNLAASACSALGPSRTLYPIPATSTDPVYAVIAARPEEKFWIRRRGGRTCTNLNKALGTWDLLDEDVCRKKLLAICKDCRLGGDGC